MIGWTRLSHRCRFLLTGADRVRYLNGQVTNQVEHLVEGESRYAVITNHKGQLEGDLYISSQDEPEGLYLDADASIQEFIHTRLDRYIIADDVELNDVTDAWRGMHLLGIEAESLAPSLPSDVQVIRTNRVGIEGLDLWCPESIKDSVILEDLTELHLKELDDLALQWLRISQGISQWGHELTPGLLPPEARIESRAIDYQKGCYIGQEIISRIKSVGKVNRRLVLLALEPDGAQPEPGQSLWLPQSSEDSPAQGVLTSLASHPDVQEHPREVLALGYLKSQHAIEGTHVIAGKSPSAASAKFTVLPFPAPS
ncbi:MAG: folate-binding protein YgfZ [Verrucomicrobiales bacterium]|jgi:folate-binding protein YgfZ